MPKKISVLFIVPFVLAGCAPGKVAVASFDKRVEIIMPSIDVDRYEPVVFPAGRLP